MNTSCRLLLLTENYPPQRGGMSQSCDRIVFGLRQRGYTVDLLHFTSRVKKIHVDRQMNGQLISIPFEESEAHTLNVAWTFIKQSVPGPDVVICFGGYLPMLAAPVYARWLSVPLLTLLRGNDFDSSLFTPRKKSILDDALQASAYVTVVSSEKKEKLQLLYPDVAASYVPNGISADDWTPTPSESVFAENWRSIHAKDKLVLGLIGQLKAKKGAGLLLDALNETTLADEIHLLLVGDIDTELLSRVEQQAIAFSHLAFLDRFELLKYYLCCDAIVIPSYYDGMPNVLLEAGALGIPVIASNVDGMKDVITPGHDGLLFRAGDTLHCRQLMYDFKQLTLSRRQDMGNALAETIRTKYNSNLELDNYENIIEICLRAARSPGQLRASSK